MSPVFDKNKYRALQKELEITETDFASLSGKIRMDAEHYQKKYMSFVSTVTANKYFVLKDLIREPIVTGHTPSMKNNDFYGGSVPFIKTDNLREFYIGDSFSDKLSLKGCFELANSRLCVNDIIATIIGATEKIIGRAALVTEEMAGSCINQNIVRIRLKQGPFSPEFLTAYINSQYGHVGLLYNSRQTEQVNLNCREVEDLLVPYFSSLFIQTVTIVVRNALSLHSPAKNLFLDAENLLLEELGLIDWRPVSETTLTKSFSDFQKFGRLDAEYYQSKYREIKNKLEQYTQGTVSCGTLLKNATTKLDVETEYNYIELRDIGQNGEIGACTRDFTENLPSRARQRVKTNDIIVSSIEGSLSSCALITEEYNNAICSTGFHVLRSSEINPETLLLLMKSWPIQALLKQGCSGTILTAILPDALKQINIPLIRENIQQELAAMVQESFALRKESKRLLNLAKHAIEVAIKQNEVTAIKLFEEEQNA